MTIGFDRRLESSGQCSTRVLTARSHSSVSYTHVLDATSARRCTFCVISGHVETLEQQ